ncbi:hypothetical protein [Solibacillus sp. FSL H8-0538]|uniref:hypothetical protein n=1 Tax=Solibacillus sp. FSL H8-0538 TaxID=2921400 RepID=UPI0030FABF94
MNNLKEQLKQELRSEAPFSEDMKRRILINKQPGKASVKKLNWQVYTVALAFLLILSFIGMTQDETMATKTVATLPTNQNELFTLLQENETVLPIIEPNGKLVVEPKPGASYLMGKQWMLANLPMVIEREAAIQVGDYIAYYGLSGVNVATVYGVTEDKVQMENGQITLNGEFLALPGAVKPVGDQDAEEKEIAKYYFGEREHYFKTQDYIDVELEQLRTNEYAVYSNDNGHTVKVINDNQLIGKVVGIQKLEPSFTLTTEEQSLYGAFKETYDLSLLLDVEPLTITKMYLQAEMELDYETYYALLTDRDPTRTVRANYLQRTQKIRDYYFTEDIQRLLSAYGFNGIEEGQFEQINEINGMIHFFPTSPTSTSSLETSAGMLKNEQGIWQPAFIMAID